MGLSDVYTDSDKDISAHWILCKSRYQSTHVMMLKSRAFVCRSEASIFEKFMKSRGERTIIAVTHRVSAHMFLWNLNSPVFDIGPSSTWPIEATLSCSCRMVSSRRKEGITNS